MNHSESLRIAENHPRFISERFENYLGIILECFVNHWESLRIAPRIFHSGLRITKNYQRIISEWFVNPEELPRIMANHWDSHKNNKVLSLLWSKAKWSICLKIALFVVTLTDSASPDHFHNEPHWLSGKGIFWHCYLGLAMYASTCMFHICVIYSSTHPKCMQICFCQRAREAHLFTKTFTYSRNGYLHQE